MRTLASILLLAALLVPSDGPRAADPVPAACGHPCALLRDYDFAYLERNHCALCGGGDPESEACVYDWPSSDVPSCEAWDYMRNCIYASYGYPFKQARWREVFAQEPWYRPDPSFEASRLSATANRNVKLLERKKARREQCVDEPAS